VLRIALHLTRSEAQAQDMCQEAFLRAFRSVRQFRFECSVYTWIHRIVANVCIEFLRKQQTQLDLNWKPPADDLAEQDVTERISDERPTNDPERVAYGNEVALHIRRALHGLSARERLTFELKHYHGLSARSIGAMTNRSEGSVKTMLCRAVKKLRVELSDIRSGAIRR
jgi:RNA polymerase sigma-70 factor (ECF subfamily)